MVQRSQLVCCLTEVLVAMMEGEGTNNETVKWRFPQVFYYDKGAKEEEEKTNSVRYKLFSPEAATLRHALQMR